MDWPRAVGSAQELRFSGFCPAGFGFMSRVDLLASIWQVPEKVMSRPAGHSLSRGRTSGGTGRRRFETRSGTARGSIAGHGARRVRDIMWDTQRDRKWTIKACRGTPSETAAGHHAGQARDIVRDTVRDSCRTCDGTDAGHRVGRSRDKWRDISRDMWRDRRTTIQACRGTWLETGAGHHAGRSRDTVRHGCGT
jgi:hypothetical protein